MTRANTLGIFCGRGNYPLCQEGIDDIISIVEKHPYDKVDRVYSSPLLRCVETAHYAYPKQALEIVEDLQEIDFGDYEFKQASTAKELDNYDEYMRFEPTFAFPNGETLGDLASRGVKSIKEIIKKSFDNDDKSIGIVTHSMLFLSAIKELGTKLPELSNLFLPNGMGISFETDEEYFKETGLIRCCDLEPKGATRPDMTKSPYHTK